MLFFEDTYKSNSDVFDNILRLSPEEISDPYLLLKAFFDRYSLSEIRVLLHKLKWVAITTENTEFFEPIDRANMLFELENVEQLIEAACLLSQRKGKRKS